MKKHSKKLRRVAILALVLVLLFNTMGVQADTGTPKVTVSSYGELYSAYAEATDGDVIGVRGVIVIPTLVSLDKKYVTFKRMEAGAKLYFSDTYNSEAVSNVRGITFDGNATEVGGTDPFVVAGGKINFTMCDFLDCFYQGDNGGALYIAYGEISLSGCSFEGNSALNGSHIYNNGILTLDTCTFKDGWADEKGGALYNAGTAYINFTEFKGNNARIGGGIYNSASMEISNSLVWSNTATAQGADIANEGSLTNNTTEEQYNSWLDYYNLYYAGWEDDTNTSIGGSGDYMKFLTTTEDPNTPPPTEPSTEESTEESTETPPAPTEPTDPEPTDPAPTEPSTEPTEPSTEGSTEESTETPPEPSTEPSTETPTDKPTEGQEPSTETPSTEDPKPSTPSNAEEGGSGGSNTNNSTDNSTTDNSQSSSSTNTDNSNTDNSSSSSVSNVTNNTDNSSLVSSTDNSSSRNESSKTENSHNSNTTNNSTTTNNSYYTQEQAKSSQQPTGSSSQPISVNVSVPQAERQDTAVTAPTQIQGIDQNIKIDAEGVNVSYEYTADGVSISITPYNATQSPTEERVTLVDTSTPTASKTTTEAQDKPNWVESITMILLAVLVALEIKDRLRKKPE